MEGCLKDRFCEEILVICFIVAATTAETKGMICGNIMIMPQFIRPITSQITIA